MTIFGGSWGAPVCEGAFVIDAPVGEPCGFCEVAIEDGDQGVMQVFTHTVEPVIGMSESYVRPIHKECMLRQVLGGWGHHVDHAYWCTRMHDPDGGVGRRESALRVWELQHVLGGSPDA